MSRALRGLLILTLLAGCTRQHVSPMANVARAKFAAQSDGPGDSVVVETVNPLTTPRHVLVLSGGGMYGAYTAGFLGGWTQTGQRPEFDVVTGVSTGSLAGLAAFLGPKYDPVAREFYTVTRAEDVYNV